jgi:hypothetical protein
MCVMLTEMVSNIIAWCHAYSDGVKYLQLGIISTEIVSNIIAWCHVYIDCVKYYSLMSCLQKLFQIFRLMLYLQRLCQIL